MTELPSGFLEGAPDLAVEVLSPGNTVEEIDAKIAEYFENGTRLVWVISPTQHYILVYRSAQEPDRLLKSVDNLDGEKDLNCPIWRIFWGQVTASGRLAQIISQKAPQIPQSNLRRFCCQLAKFSRVTSEDRSRRRLLNLQQLHVKNQRCVGRNYAASPARSVA